MFANLIWVASFCPCSGEGLGPDIVHVCPELTLSATYRPTVSALRAAGIPKSGRQAWYFDADSNEFRRLTPGVRSKLSGRRDG